MAVSIIEKHAKGEGDSALITEALSLLKIGAASPPIASVSMVLMLEALGKIVVGKTYTAPVSFGVALEQGSPPTGTVADVNLSSVFIHTLSMFNPVFGLLGSAAKAANLPELHVVEVKPDPDGVDKDNKPYWNVYLIDPHIKTVTELALLGYLVGTGVAGAGGNAQLTSLISGGLAMVK